jgi:hypothetical protein
MQRKIPSINANALSDTDSSSDSDGYDADNNQEGEHCAAATSSYVEMVDKQQQQQQQQQQQPAYYTSNLFGVNRSSEKPQSNLFGVNRSSGKPPRIQGYTSKLMGKGAPTAALSLDRSGSILSIGSLD